MLLQWVSVLSLIKWLFLLSFLPAIYASQCDRSQDELDVSTLAEVDQRVYKKKTQQQGFIGFWEHPVLSVSL